MRVCVGEYANYAKEKPIAEQGNCHTPKLGLVYYSTFFLTCKVVFEKNLKNF